MNASQLWAAIAAVAVVAFAVKAVGPALLGGRELPLRAEEVVAVTAPALLAGFVVVDLAGPGWSGPEPALVGGLAAAVGLRMCRAPLPVVLLGAAAATALLRPA